MVHLNRPELSACRRVSPFYQAGKRRTSYVTSRSRDVLSARLISLRFVGGSSKGAGKSSQVLIESFRQGREEFLNRDLTREGTV